jgi:DNA-binding SARP family transcriptional activator
VSWQFRVLGPLEIERDGETVHIGAAQQRALLVTLLLDGGRVVPVERLIDSLWGDAPPTSARTTLHSLVKRLRRVLEPPADGPDRRGDPARPWTIVQCRAPGYRITVPPESVDLARFDDLAHRGRVALDRGDPSSSAAYLRMALDLWRGDALADITAEGLRRSVLPALSERYASAVETCIEAELQLGRHRDLVAELRGLVGRFPMREHLHRLLITALYRSGRRAEALGAYQDLRGRLVEDLGVEPDLATQRLHSLVLRSDSPAFDGTYPSALDLLLH